MLEIIDYINRNGLQSLCDTYHIAAKRHGRYPNLVQLKYDQIESPMGEKVVQQCRGIILDEADNWKVIAYPYDKFFNYGEEHAAQIDWSTARVYEKVDGSLMILYHYRDEWHVASSGLPDASGRVNGASMTFAELFWDIWGQLDYYLPDDTGCCYMFELCTPLNRVIVPHTESRIVYHGERQLIDGYREQAPVYDHVCGWEVVKSFPLNSLESVIASCQKINPMSQEGYVVCDASFNRVKVKSPQYVALSHLKEGMSARRLIEIAVANESMEFLSYFPEWRQAFEYVTGEVAKLIDQIEQAWFELRGISDRKTFALAACRTRMSTALFALRDDKAESVRKFLQAATIQSVERALKLDEVRITDALCPATSSPSPTPAPSASDAHTR